MDGATPNWTWYRECATDFVKLNNYVCYGNFISKPVEIEKKQNDQSEHRRLHLPVIPSVGCLLKRMLKNWRNSILMRIVSRSEKCHKQFYLDRGRTNRKEKRGCRLSFFCCSSLEAHGVFARLMRLHVFFHLKNLRLETAVVCFEMNIWLEG